VDVSFLHVHLFFLPATGALIEGKNEESQQPSNITRATLLREERIMSPDGVSVVLAALQSWGREKPDCTSGRGAGNAGHDHWWLALHPSTLGSWQLEETYR